MAPMRPSTGSRSGAPRDQEDGLTKVGSRAAPLDLLQSKDKKAVDDQEAAEYLSQLDSSDDNEVSGHDSPSTDSDCAIEGVVKSGVVGTLNTELIKDVGGLVADHVFDDLPQSSRDAAVGYQGGDASGRVNEKAKGDALKAPWVNLFKDNRNMGKGIMLEAVDGDGELIMIEEEDVDTVEEVWGYCLVGQFAGKFPGLVAVRNIREGWKVKCTYWIHRSRWIVFKFQSEEDRLTVLNGGPYFAYGVNLMLKIMPRCFRFGGEDFATLPVWVQLPDLPLDCWNERALSKIVSKVGKPITTDKMTRTKERLSFARVLVEVDASKDLVRGVDLRLPTGEVYRQLVVFEFIPKFCKKCKTFGHVEGDCKKELGDGRLSAYVPKKKQQVGGRMVNKNLETGAVKGGPKVPIEEPKFQEDASAKAGDLSAADGQSAIPLGDVLVHGSSEAAVETVEGELGKEHPAPVPSCQVEDRFILVKGGEV